MSVHQLRLVVTADDYDDAVRFYRDVLGLTELGAFSGEHGHVTILDAGRATLELTDPAHAAFIDEVEVGTPRRRSHARRVRGGRRGGTTRRLEAAGAAVLAGPTPTPWGSLNSRLDGPAGLQLTLFQESEQGERFTA